MIIENYGEKIYLKIIFLCYALINDLEKLKQDDDDDDDDNDDDDDDDDELFLWYG